MEKLAQKGFEAPYIWANKSLVEFHSTDGQYKITEWVTQVLTKTVVFPKPEGLQEGQTFGKKDATNSDDVGTLPSTATKPDTLKILDTESNLSDTEEDDGCIDSQRFEYDEGEKWKDSSLAKNVVEIEERQEDIPERPDLSKNNANLATSSMAEASVSPNQSPPCLCPFCMTIIKESDQTVQLTQKGIDSIHLASKQRKDTDFFLKVGQKVHKQCRQVYIHPQRIAAARKKRTERDRSESPSLRSNTPTFDFRTCCFYCGQNASEDESNVGRCRTLGLKDSILKCC